MRKCQIFLRTLLETKLLALVVGICAEMNETSFEFIKFFSAAVRDCAEMDETSFEFIQLCSAAGQDLRRDE